MGKCGCFFFPRDNSLISRGNSHVSRVRGLVVRCLLFNPEVSCSNPWVCANFLQVFRSRRFWLFSALSDFSALRDFFSALWDFFFEIFLMSPKSPPFNFLIFCKRTNVKKSQRVPFFRIFGTMRLFKILIFFKHFLDSLIFKNFLMYPKRPPFNFLISCNRTNVIKS